MHILNKRTLHFECSCVIIMVLLFFTFPFTDQTNTDITNFNFTQFSSGNIQDLVLEGDAELSILNNIIELTDDIQEMSSNGSVGRVTYSKPIHLWDKATGNVADFTTHFSFIIQSESNQKQGHGFAFFLAPSNSHLQPFSGGAFLGLMSKNSSTLFAAVEFDTAWSSWDPEPEEPHIGIDLNSMKSVDTTSWIGVGTIDAWIHYNSTPKNLSVLVSNVYDGSTTHYSLSSCPLDLTVLPEWISVGFSASSIKDFYETHNIFSWDFASTLQLPENLTKKNSTNHPNHTQTPPLWSPPASVNHTQIPPVRSPPASLNHTEIPPVLSPTISSERNTDILPRTVIVGVIVGSVCFFSLIIGLCLYCYFRLKNRSEDANDEFRNEIGPRGFSYMDLVTATNNFSDKNLLGKGGSGEVYKGFLKRRNDEIAVKWIKPISGTGLKEYESEVKSISQSRHKNLLKLIGWCRKNQELFIVYEYMPKDSVAHHLLKRTGELTWEKRYGIASGLASALHYLQEYCDCKQYVLHRDIKSSNVLLDSEYNAKLGDFGLARVVENEIGSHTTKLMMGSAGYIAPEYEKSHRATKESDIYAFGIVALEMASGKLVYRECDENGNLILVKWVRIQYESGGVWAVADKELRQIYIEVEMERLIIVGLACTQPDHSRRPSIREVIAMLKGEFPLPQLQRFETLELETQVPQDLEDHRAIVLNNSSSSATTNGDCEINETHQHSATVSSNYVTAITIDHVPLMQANASNISRSSTASVANICDIEIGHTQQSTTDSNS